MKPWLVAGTLAVVSQPAILAVAVGLSALTLRNAAVVGLGLLLLAVVALAVALFKEHSRLTALRHELTRSEIRAKALIEASPDGIALIGGTRIVFANPAFRAMLSLPPDEKVVGRGILDLVAPCDREKLRGWLEQRQAGAAEPEKMELTGLRLSGAEVQLEAAAALLPTRTGRQLALFLRDLTGRRSLETRIAHLERLEALADLGESLIQDFDKMFLRARKLARSVAGSDDNVEIKKALERVERLASRGAAMTRRVRSLAPSAVDRSTHRKLDVVKLVRDVAADFLRTIGSAASLRVSSETGHELITSGDAPQIRQAIWQVLRNALQAEEDGEIEIRTTKLVLDATHASRIPGSRPGTYAVVEIEDHGPGMDEEMRAKALQPFFTTRGGRQPGLGLTLAYGTTRGHGGYLVLESEERRGTLVRLAFPLLPEGERAEDYTEEVLDPRARWRGRENVLLVDDDLALRQEAARILEDFGYHVELAATPRAALQRLRQRPQIDLVLLDMVLPGWNGLDVLSRILRHWPGQRVLMVSPYPLQEQQDQAMQLGAVGIYMRPYVNPGLARAARGALDRPPPAAV